MKEFKFRAWDLLGSRMLQWGDIFDLPAWEIFPGTPEQRAFDVMQYTGLKDINGKEIYENDIVNISDKDGLEKAEIIFDPHLGSFCVIGYLGDLRTYPLANYLFGGYQFEVIGNIYQDGDLLEKS